MSGFAKEDDARIRRLALIELLDAARAIQFPKTRKWEILQDAVDECERHFQEVLQ